MLNSRARPAVLPDTPSKKIDGSACMRCQLCINAIMPGTWRSQNTLGLFTGCALYNSSSVTPSSATLSWSRYVGGCTCTPCELCTIAITSEEDMIAYLRSFHRLWPVQLIVGIRVSRPLHHALVLCYLM